MTSTCRNTSKAGLPNATIMILLYTDYMHACMGICLIANTASLYLNMTLLLERSETTGPGGWLLWIQLLWIPELHIQSLLVWSSVEAIPLPACFCPIQTFRKGETLSMGELILVIQLKIPNWFQTTLDHPLLFLQSYCTYRIGLLTGHPLFPKQHHSHPFCMPDLMSTCTLYHARPCT